MNERIAQLIEYLNLNPTSFEKQIGVKRGRISTALSKNTTFAADVISKICAKYTEISARWLLLGEGEMLRKGGQNFEKGELQPPKTDYAISQAAQKIIDTQDKLIASLEEQIASLKEQLEQSKGGHAYMPSSAPGIAV